MLREIVNVNNTNEIPACPMVFTVQWSKAAIRRQTGTKIECPRQVSLGTVNVQIQKPKTIQK